MASKPQLPSLCGDGPKLTYRGPTLDGCSTPRGKCSFCGFHSLSKILRCHAAQTNHEHTAKNTRKMRWSVRKSQQTLFAPTRTAAVETLTRLHTSPSTGDITSMKTPEEDGLNSPLMKFTAVLVDMSG